MYESAGTVRRWMTSYCDDPRVRATNIFEREGSDQADVAVSVCAVALPTPMPTLTSVSIAALLLSSRS